MSRASSNLPVIFWKKLICCCKKYCICALKSRTRMRWKCWISASVAQEMMLQRSLMPPPAVPSFWLSLALVRAPGERQRMEVNRKGKRTKVRFKGYNTITSAKTHACTLWVFHFEHIKMQAQTNHGFWFMANSSLWNFLRRIQYSQCTISQFWN